MADMFTFRSQWWPMGPQWDPIGRLRVVPGVSWGAVWAPREAPRGAIGTIFGYFGIQKWNPKVLLVIGKELWVMGYGLVIGNW